MTRQGGEGVMDRGRWREKGRDVWVRGCEPAPRGWEDHVGAGMWRVEEWMCQMGRKHEGPDVEGDSGPLSVSPRQHQPVYQTWGYVTTGGQGDVGRTGDSSTREVAGARDEEGCRKGDEARAWHMDKGRS